MFTDFGNVEKKAATACRSLKNVCLLFQMFSGHLNVNVAHGLNPTLESVDRNSLGFTVDLQTHGARPWITTIFGQTRPDPDRLNCFAQAQSTQDARAQIPMQTLWSCLRAVQTRSFTSTGPICLCCACGSSVDWASDCHKKDQKIMIFKWWSWCPLCFVLCPIWGRNIYVFFCARTQLIFFDMTLLFRTYTQKCFSKMPSFAAFVLLFA